MYPESTTTLLGRHNLRLGAVVQYLRRPDKGRNVQVKALPAPPLLRGNNTQATKPLDELDKLGESVEVF